MEASKKAIRSESRAAAADRLKPAETANLPFSTPYTPGKIRACRTMIFFEKDSGTHNYLTSLFEKLVVQGKMKSINEF
jgi:hypothetical protein